MQHPIRIITTITKNGSLTIKGLPVRAGEVVEITISSKTQKLASEKSRHPLRGQPIQFHSPFDSVAEKDWELLR
jgi:hypothetical protein